MRRFHARLNSESLKRLEKELTDYRDSLDAKTELFMNRLLELGIKVGRENAVDIEGEFGTHEMGRYVTFEKKVQTEDGSCKGIMLAMGETLYSKWFVQGGEERHGSINAIMALEFGTAAMAVSERESFGAKGGQGTNSDYGHENDLRWYIYTGLDEKGRPSKRKKATAITPTRPMMNAGNAMAADIVRVAREVFGGETDVVC